MRIGERHPGEERLVDLVEPVDRTIRDPGRRVILLRDLVLPRLRVVPRRAGGLGLHAPQPLVALLGTVTEQVARIVKAERRRAERPVPSTHQIRNAQVVPEDRHLQVLEPKVRTVPVGGDERGTVDRLDLAGRQERERRREVRLAEQRGAMAGPTEQRRQRSRLGIGGQVDPVARDAVRRRVGARKYRRPRRLAQHVLRARLRKPRSLRGERVEPWRRAERAARTSQRVSPLLVGRDEQDVHEGPFASTPDGRGLLRRLHREHRWHDRSRARDRRSL